MYTTGCERERKTGGVTSSWAAKCLHSAPTGEEEEGGITADPLRRLNVRLRLNTEVVHFPSGFIIEKKEKTINVGETPRRGNVS